MRATSLPTAPTTAATALLLPVALALLAAPSTAAAARWLRPVPGEVARSFDYTQSRPFARGSHRGADFAAAPGAPVRSACAGRVVHAGAVLRHGRVVTVACGARRVTYLPLRAVVVRRGAAVALGGRVGTVASGHGGLHVGVRRAGDRLAYEDPLARLAPRRPARPVTPMPSRGPRPLALAPLPAAPVVSRRPEWGVRPTVSSWPIWAGITLLGLGAAGSRSIVRRRRPPARAAVMPRPVMRTAAPTTAGRGRLDH